jgi:hypothetical protein
VRILVLALVLLPFAATAQERPATAQERPATAQERPATAQERPAKAPKACRVLPQVASKPRSLRVRPLGQEPLADAYLPVVRTVDGCDAPVKIRDNIGREQR